MMKHLGLVSILAMATSAVGCVPLGEDTSEIAAALPRAEDVRINLPTAMPRALGEVAPWYVATRDVTLTFNGGTAWVLTLVHTIVQFPVTSVEGNVYTWGPWGDGLDPAEYRLDVTALEDGSYQWALSGRSRAQAAGAFEVVLDGHAVPGAAFATGNGSFNIDFDAAERVNPIDNDGVGAISVNYDLAAGHLDMIIDTVEDRGNGPEPVHAEYAYDEVADGSGNMVFAINGDSDDAGSLREDAVIRSRWQADGAGRADLRLSNGDLADAVITGSECWDANFLRVYWSDSVGHVPTEGDVADCAFATSDLPPE